MSVTPQLQNFLAGIAQIKSYLVAIDNKPSHANAREALANITRANVTDFDSTLFAVDDVVINDKFPVPIRIYNPAPDSSLPVAVFIHGGGHMCGSIAVYDGIVRKLAKSINHIVISIDYRLAPECPYPTGLNDSKAAIAQTFEILDQRGITYKSQELTLIGDSGGGAIVSSIAMDKQFILQHNITKQVLIYPATDYLLEMPSTIELASGYFLETAKVAWYYDNYFQNDEDRREASPLHGKFYPEMPKTLVIVASHDILRDEGIAYYQKLVDIGVDCELITINGVLHAYLMLENLCTEECEFTRSEIAKFLNA